MSNVSTYTVISTGKIHDDFGVEDVKNSFAKLFKTTPEKANAYVGVQKVLKKDLEHTKAQALKSRLESIGMVIALKEHKPAAKADAMSLSIEEKEPVKADTTMTCPKCDLRQEKAEQCAGCGVFVQKLLAPSANDAAIGSSTVIGQSTAITEPQAEAMVSPTAPAATTITTTTTVQEGDSLKISGIAAAAVAAVVGALIWKFITVFFNYELGFIAWGIGLAVGVGAAMFDSKGMSTGIICGIFALLAIFGGKYMAMQTFQETWANDIATSIEGQEAEFKEYYQQDLKAAEAFSEGVESKEALIKFMTEHGYSEFYEVKNITDEEITDFNEYVVPHLKKIAEEQPSFDEWVKGSFGEALDDVSTLELVKSDIGIMGIIFLFLGVGTAFKIGKGDE